MGTSSSDSSNRFSGSLGLSMSLEKYKLLDDTIEKIIIGIEPLGPDLGHKISYYTGIIRYELPSHLGGGKFLYHLSCLLRLGKADESIILEYGAYYGTEPSYDNYIHYVYDPEKEGGLRFSKMDFND